MDDSLTQALTRHRSDKVTTHKYGMFYELALGAYRSDDNFKLLEIGTTGVNGGSIKAWRNYFSGKVYGVDISPPDPTLGIPQIQADAYTDDGIGLIEDEFGYMDVIIDDGPHTYESHDFFLGNYSKVLRSGGVLMAEDCAAYYNLSHLAQLVEKHQAYAVDLRLNAGVTSHDIILIKKKPA
jgi:hypothetical protein